MREIQKEDIIICTLIRRYYGRQRNNSYYKYVWQDVDDQYRQSVKTKSY